MSVPPIISPLAAKGVGLMTPRFQRIVYRALNSRQKENFNFQKVSAILADYGFVTLRLNDDWQGADFIAQHIDGTTFLKVQLKGRLSFDRKYLGKGIWVAFRSSDALYLYPHDELFQQFSGVTNIANTSSWTDKGGYSFPTLSVQILALLEPYRLIAAASSSGVTEAESCDPSTE